jgi:hypothetical protein
MNDFLKLCRLTGISDFLYDKGRIPPKWMNKREVEQWRNGYNLARQACYKK